MSEQTDRQPSIDTGPTRRRSCLSVPGSSERMLAKARELGADEIVIDLEDAVAPGHKQRARTLVVEQLRSGALAGVTVAVRVNAVGTPWCHQDLTALASEPAGPATVVVPKVEGSGDLAFVDRLLDGVEAQAGHGRRTGIQALIETASGLQRVAEIATASHRLETMILGYADLGASLGRPDSAPTSSWQAAQHAVLVAARSGGLQAIDGPLLTLDDDEALRAAAATVRDLGFDGKWAIHPRQIPTLNETFTPDEAAVAAAKAVLDALQAAEAAGHGAVAHGGVMLDAAVAKAARGVLSRAGLY
jgi:citrate lyase subunit beta/citryl-CoA lyase